MSSIHTRTPFTFAFLAVTLVALLFPARHVLAKGTSAITGVVVAESSGQPVAGTAVTVTPTGAAAITDEAGRFRIEVAPGRYSLEASFTGHARALQEVEVGTQPVEITVTLRDDPRYAETIVVVGARTPRSVARSPVPIDVITSEQIQEAGEAETNQVLRAVAPSYNASHQTTSDGTDHIDPASLRGLGPDQVLVLINGKRRHSSALTNVNDTFGRGTVGVDLNAIPTTAIERIEVLRDGAAAQYGSDAIAGVINIQLKEAPGVVEATAMSGLTGSGDGFQLKTGLNYGVPIGDLGVVNLTAELLQRNRTDRSGEWTGTFYPDVEEGAATDRALEDSGLTRDDISTAVGQSQATAGTVFYNARIPMGELEAYSTGGVTHRGGEAAGIYRRPEQVDRNVEQVYPDGFLPLISPTIFDWSAGAGVRTERDREGLEWDLSANHGGNWFDYRVENSINASLGEASPRDFDAGGFSFTQTSANADAVLPIDTQLVDRLALAAGAEYRLENFRIHQGERESWEQGDELQPDGMPRAGGAQVFPGFQPSNRINEYRNSAGAYLGVETELNQRLLVDVAGRFDNHDDFGSTISGKLAARFDIVEQLAVRGAVSNGFRAPSLHQVHFNSTSTQFVTNPDTNLPEPRQVLTSSNVSEVAEAFGMPRLHEETSISMSGGVTITPFEDLSITADTYYITIDDRIVLTSQFTEATVMGVNDLLEQFEAQAAQFFANAVDTRTFGTDVVIDYTTDVGGGRLGLTAAGNVTRTRVQRVNIPQGVADAFAGGDLDAVRGVIFSREEKNRLEDAQPREKGLVQGRYAIGPIAGLLRASYYGKVVFKGTGEMLDEELGAKVTLDADFAYQLGGGFKVALGASNLLNTFPDEQTNPDNVSFGQFIYSRRATQFGINGGFYYLRLQYLY